MTTADELIEQINSHIRSFRKKEVSFQDALSGISNILSHHPLYWRQIPKITEKMWQIFFYAKNKNYNPQMLREENLIPFTPPKNTDQEKLEIAEQEIPHAIEYWIDQFKEDMNWLPFLKNKNNLDRINNLHNNQLYHYVANKYILCSLTRMSGMDFFKIREINFIVETKRVPRNLKEEVDTTRQLLIDIFTNRESMPGAQWKWLERTIPALKVIKNNPDLGDFVQEYLKLEYYVTQFDPDNTPSNLLLPLLFLTKDDVSMLQCILNNKKASREGSQKLMIHLANNLRSVNNTEIDFNSVLDTFLNNIPNGKETNIDLSKIMMARKSAYPKQNADKIYKLVRKLLNNSGDSNYITNVTLSIVSMPIQEIREKILNKTRKLAKPPANTDSSSSITGNSSRIRCVEL